MRAASALVGAALVIAADRCRPPKIGQDRTIDVDCSERNMQEDALPRMHAECGTDWVLRLDDDESIGEDAVSWLIRFARYPEDGKRTFCMPRMNLFGNERTYIAEEGLWPDLQTRLLRRDVSPHAHIHHGIDADYAVRWPILHHKFLVKDYEHRKKIAERYESLGAGMGLGPWFMRFSLPELAFPDGPKTKTINHHEDAGPKN